MINLKKELADNQTILVDVSIREYNHIIIEITKQLAKDKKVCFVNFNKNFYSLIRLFQKNKVNLSNLFFIDGISAAIKDPDKISNAVFLYHPSNLTAISIAISKSLKENFDYLIFDSVSSLEAYNSMGVLERFMSFLIDKIYETKTKAIVLHPRILKDDALIAELGMELDKTVEYADEDKVNVVKPVLGVLVGLGFVGLLGSGVTGRGTSVGKLSIGGYNAAPLIVLFLTILLFYMLYRYSYYDKPFDFKVPKRFKRLKTSIEKSVDRRGAFLKKKKK